MNFENSGIKHFSHFFQWKFFILASVCILISYPFAYLILRKFIFACIACGLFSCYVITKVDVFFGSIAARIHGDNSITWAVSMNGVNIGSIHDSVYASIQLKVFHDYRNYLAQAKQIIFTILGLGIFNKSGFVNCFSNAINLAVCKRCGVAAAGEMKLLHSAELA